MGSWSLAVAIAVWVAKNIAAAAAKLPRLLLSALLTATSAATATTDVVKLCVEEGARPVALPNVVPEPVVLPDLACQKKALWS